MHAHDLMQSAQARVARTFTKSAVPSIRERAEMACTRTRLVRHVNGDAFAECICSAATDRRRAA